DITFEELHKLAGQNGYRDLYVVGTNLTLQKPEIFSHETYPKMRVRDAVRISMSIPLYFRAVLLNEKGEIVHKAKKDEKVQVIVDGGILANYPIDIFDHPRFNSALSATDSAGKTFNPQTLGIRLERDEQIEYDR